MNKLISEIQKPLTEIEKAELSTACSEFLTEQGKMLLRRLLFQSGTSKQINNDYIKWAKDDAVEWSKAKHSNVTDAFRQGIIHGYHQAVADLKMHGLIK